MVSGIVWRPLGLLNVEQSLGHLFKNSLPDDSLPTSFVETVGDPHRIIKNSIIAFEVVILFTWPFG